MSSTELLSQSPAESTPTVLTLLETKPNRLDPSEITRLTFEVRQLKFGIQDILESMQRVRLRIQMCNLEPYPEDIAQLTTLQLYYGELQSQLATKEQFLNDVMTPIQAFLQAPQPPLELRPILTYPELKAKIDENGAVQTSAEVVVSQLSPEQQPPANDEQEHLAINDQELASFIVDQLKDAVQSDSAVSLLSYDSLVRKFTNNTSTSKDHPYTWEFEELLNKTAQEQGYIFENAYIKPGEPILGEVWIRLRVNKFSPDGDDKRDNNDEPNHPPEKKPNKPWRKTSEVAQIFHEYLHNHYFSGNHEPISYDIPMAEILGRPWEKNDNRYLKKIIPALEKAALSLGLRLELINSYASGILGKKTTVRYVPVSTEATIPGNDTSDFCSGTFPDNAANGATVDGKRTDAKSDNSNGLSGVGSEGSVLSGDTRAELPNLTKMLAIIAEAKVNFLKVLLDLNAKPITSRFEQVSALINLHYPKTQIQKSLLLEAGMGEIENLTYVLTAQELAILLSVREAGFKIDETFAKVYELFVKNPSPVIPQVDEVTTPKPVSIIPRRRTSRDRRHKREPAASTKTAETSERYSVYNNTAVNKHQPFRSGKKKRK